MDVICYEISSNGVPEFAELSSNQEEADTKMILYCAQAPATNETGRNLGDADISIVSKSLILEDGYCVFINFNTGRNRKILCSKDTKRFGENGIDKYTCLFWK